MMSSNKRVQYACFVLLLILLTLDLGGCVPSSVATEPTVTALSVPNGTYGAVVWLRTNLIAMAFRENPNSSIRETEIHLYNIDTHETQVLPFEKPERCGIGGIGNIGKLPDGSVGFVYDCRVDLNSKLQATLYSWEIETGEIHQVYEFPNSFHANDFAFAPDMTKFLVEVKGDGINNELYYVAVNGEPEKILPDFNRVGVPDWSLDGQMIAFAANEKGSGNSTNLFSGAPGLHQAMDFPWNIYLMNNNTGDSQILLENVQHVHIIKFSPQSNRLAFWGTVNEKEGIWILNLETSEMIRVWDEQTSFDWSPDGQKMILRAHEDRDGTTWGYPVIIDIPKD